MNLLQTIIDYYHGEARHDFWMAFIGALLLIGGIVLLKWAAPLSLLKALTIPMFLFGLIVGIGGAADGIYTRKITTTRVEQYQKDSKGFLIQEKVKVEKTHRGWPGLRRMWTILSISGAIIAAILFRKPFWLGAGLGMAGLAVLISLFELFSMRFNERYYHIIMESKVNAASSLIQENPADEKQETTKVHVLQTYIDPKLSERKLEKSAGNNSRSDNLSLDSLKCIAAPVLAATVINDSINLDVTTFVPQPAKAIETAQLKISHRKKEKLLDYYNSDLIQSGGVSARHCLFNKKFIKQ